MVFISHSSNDKALVRRIGADLLTEGISIWLDEIYADLGDQLSTTLTGAIGQSSYVVLVISRHSVRSKWVACEIEWALQNEQELNRKILIPIKIDDTPPPANIADRIHADFTSYTSGLARLVEFREKQGLAAERQPLGRCQFALSFRDHIHLDYRALRAALRHTKSYYGGTVREDQLFVVYEDDYIALRNRAFARLDSITEDSYYTADFASDYAERMRIVRKMENDLARGIAHLINHFRLDRESEFSCVFEACHFFAMCWRSALIRLLYELQNPDLPEQSLGKDFERDLRGDRGVYAHLGSEWRNPTPHERCHLDVFYPDYSWGASIWIFDQSGLRQNFLSEGNVPRPVVEALSSSQITWFLCRSSPPSIWTAYPRKPICESSCAGCRSQLSHCT
jgi:hypothetical protein